jgi:hypothetical protein
MFFYNPSVTEYRLLGLIKGILPYRKKGDLSLLLGECNWGIIPIGTESGKTEASQTRRLLNSRTQRGSSPQQDLSVFRVKLG